MLSSQAVEHDPNRLGIQLVFLGKDARLKRFGGVTREYRNRPLRDDATVVERLVDMMHRYAGDRGTGFNDRSMHPSAIHPASAEGGQQGRVHVDDSPRVRANHVRRNE